MNQTEKKERWQDKIANFDYLGFFQAYKRYIFFGILALSALILCIGLLIPRGTSKEGIKSTKLNAYVDRYLDAAKDAAKASPDSPAAIIPEVTEKEEPKYNTTTLTYGEKAVVEIYSNKETNAINGSSLRVLSPSATRREDEEYFFSQVKVMIKNSDPKATRNQIDCLVELFRAAVPDPEAEGYTGFSGRNETLHDISYMAYFDYSVDPASLELLVS